MISLDKTYMSGDREVRLYCIDAGGTYPIHGAVWSPTDLCWRLTWWTEEGIGSSHANLVETKEKLTETVWLNVYKYGKTLDIWFHRTRDLAEEKEGSQIFARIKLPINVTEGEGLGKRAGQGEEV